VGYPKAQAVINLNGDLLDATHYNRTLALTGDIGVVIGQLLAAVGPVTPDGARKQWLEDCWQAKVRWRAFLTQRQTAPRMHDDVWQRPVLSQPAALKAVCDFAKQIQAVKFFDAGDVQANGFQTVEDDQPFDTFTETGASYMGFATCAVIASGLARDPRYAIAFTGDGSFMMNPQALISAVEHGARGLVVIFDNRRMAAISGLQHAQYGVDFRTNDSVAVDYVRMASSIAGVQAFWGGETLESLRQALDQAHAHTGVSVVHVPVYAGTHADGGLGAYGSWNVGNWCDDVQRRYHASQI
jgi:3D-(3,5/4)-trihydroxycyclohexane-1,2-dione acylhydrolase (decyclizing)